eukprot:RCo041553
MGSCWADLCCSSCCGGRTKSVAALAPVLAVHSPSVYSVAPKATQREPPFSPSSLQGEPMVVLLGSSGLGSSSGPNLGVNDTKSFRSSTTVSDYLNPPWGCERVSATPVADGLAGGFGFVRPIFKLPEGIRSRLLVWFDDSLERTEITVIYCAHEKSWIASDPLLEALRHPLYGVIEDLRSFSLFKDLDGNYVEVSFQGTYSGSQGWDEHNPIPMDRVVPYSHFAVEVGTARPVVWVNTWSHLMGEANANPTLRLHTCTSYAVKLGGRADIVEVFGQPLLDAVEAAKVLKVGSPGKSRRQTIWPRTSRSHR